MDNYKRSYINLKIIDNEGGNNGKARGYAKIEKRRNNGILTIYAENLDVNLEYNGFMIAVNNETIKYVDCGSIKIDPGGIGNLKKGFDAENVEGQGFNIYGISAVGLITKNFAIPLIGFTNGEIADVKDKILKCLKPADNTATHPEATDVAVEEPEQTAESITNEEQEAQQEYGVPQEDEAQPEDVTQEKLGDNSAGNAADEIVTKEGQEPEVTEETPTDIPAQKTDMARLIENTGNLVNEIDGYMTGVKKYISNIVDYLQEVKPFEWEMPGYRWWRIDLSFTDSVYDHYLVGFYYENNDVKYLVYGMPGRFCIQEQPFGGMTGFVYWHPVNGYERKFSDEGYWILHIDAITGRIVVPLMPTPPPLFS